MAVLITKTELEKTLSQPPVQGKRELEPLKSLLTSKGVPVSVVEDSMVFDNKVEVHKRAADLWYCLEGEAVFTVGGTLYKGAPKKNADGSVNNDELRASSVVGGEEITLCAGDWLWIPAGEPHTHCARGTARLLIVKVPQ